MSNYLLLTGGGSNGGARSGVGSGTRGSFTLLDAAPEKVHPLLECVYTDSW